MMRWVIRLGLVLGAILTGALPLRAAPLPAVEFSGITQDINNGGQFSLGFEFFTTNPIQVSSLGWFDDSTFGGAGLSQSHPVGIFNAGGTLLTSTTVAPTDPLTGHFRYHAVSPVNLAAGQHYFIVGVSGSVDKFTFDTVGLTVNPSIAFLQDAFISSSTLAFPNSSDGITEAQGGGFFGPDFLLTPLLTPVPEPATLTLFGLAGLALAVARWRRRRR
jgi:hypothetical protein